MMRTIVNGVQQVFRSKRMIGLFYLANLVTGLLVMFPFKGMLSDFAGNSLMGRNLGDGVNFDILFDFTANNSGGGQMLSGLILLTAISYWMIMLFFSGGAISTLMSGESYNRTTFWGNSAKYFGRFFRLWLLSIPVLLVFYLLQMIVPLIVRIAFGSDPYEYVKMYSNGIRLGIGYIAIICYYLVFDYARMFVIRNDATKMRIALFRSLKFTFSHCGQTFVIGLFFFLLGIASLFLYNVLGSGLSSASVFAVLLLVVLQQLYILFKAVVKLSLYSSESLVFSQLAPPEPVPVVEVAPLSEPESEQAPPQLDLGTAG